MTAKNLKSKDMFAQKLFSYIKGGAPLRSACNRAAWQVGNGVLHTGTNSSPLLNQVFFLLRGECIFVCGIINAQQIFPLPCKCSTESTTSTQGSPHRHIRHHDYQLHKVDVYETTKNYEVLFFSVYHAGLDTDDLRPAV